MSTLEAMAVLKIPHFEEGFIEKVADDLVHRSLKVQKGERVFLSYDPDARAIVHRVAEKILSLGAFIDYQQRDGQLENLKWAKAELKFLKELDASLLSRIQRCDCYLSVSCPSEYKGFKLDSRRSRLSSLTSKAQREQIVDEDRTRRCGLYLPTYQQAELDNMSFEEYKKVYFKACDLDWIKIHNAQEILIEKLDSGKELVFEADLQNPDPKKRTNLKMCIEGMTFANSTIAKNYPGSEAFSAPTLDSTEGTYYSPGRFFWKGQLIRDIYLKFEKGRVTDFMVSSGHEAMQDLLDTDFGARAVGEIGIGTNPELIEDVSDGLLFEKKGASFHVALGSPYSIETYLGKAVKLDNGGESSVHWDVTNMLNRAGGSRILLDGEPIQINGRWVDDRLSVLNPRNQA